MRRTGRTGGAGENRRMVAVAGLWLAASAVPAWAGDRALVDFIGYSHELAYFAFEEYGVQDGTNLAYSTIRIVELADGRPVGAPYSSEAVEMDRPLAEIRAATRRAAAAKLRELAIDTPVEIMALAGDGITQVSGSMRFGTPAWGPPGTIEGDYLLSLETFEAPPSAACTETIGRPGLGFALSFTVDGTTRELHRDATLAEWRGCPVGYRIYAALGPFGEGSITDAVVMVASYPFGFEGPDRRFLAIPIRPPRK